MRERDSSFAEYFVARSAAMRATAFLLCGDWHRAEDLVQVAFSKLYLHWNQVNRRDALDPYVRQVLLRTFIDEDRRAWRRRERPQDATSDVAAPPVPSDDRLMLMRALAEIPPRQRAVLVLRYWEDMSIDETAATLRCSAGTVKSQAARGLDHLRTLIADPIRAE